MEQSILFAHLKPGSSATKDDILCLDFRLYTALNKSWISQLSSYVHILILNLNVFSVQQTEILALPFHYFQKGQYHLQYFN